MMGIEMLIDDQLRNGPEARAREAEAAARERDWIARELGDVPHDRVIGATCHDNPMSWVPYESLGRD